MAGGLRKLKNGKWELSCHVGFDIKGKRIRKYKHVEAKNRNEAEIKLAEFVTEIKKADYKKGGTLTLNEYYKIWMTDYAEKGLRKKTVSNYRTFWPRVQVCLGHLQLNQIRPTHLVQFYNMLTMDGVRLDKKPGGLSPTSIKHHHTFLSTMLGSALTMELINSNPCNKIRLSKLGITNSGRRKKNDNMIYTINELKELLKKLDNLDGEELKYKVILYLAIFTGCRREELLGLEWHDINSKTGEINIERAVQYTTKDGIYEDKLKNDSSERKCCVPDKIIAILNDYKIWWDNEKEKIIKRGTWTDTDKLFIQKNSNLMHPDTPSDFFRKFLKKNNLKHTKFHNLRHMHISILMNMGMDASAIADQAGHADLEMILRVYGHNVNKDFSQAAKLMKKALLDD